MSRVYRAQSMGCLLLLGLGCSKTETRPSAARDCNDPGCSAIQRSTPGSTGAVMRPGGSAGAASTPDDAGTPRAGALAGTVSMLVEADLLMTRNLDGSNPDGDLRVRTSGASLAERSGLVAADGSFRLEDVLSVSSLWVGVGTFDALPTAPFMDTLQVVDSTLAGFVDLFVIPRTVMQDLSQVAFMSTPLELDPAGAHAVLNFVDLDGVPLSGLQVTFPPDVSVAYDTGGTYSDQTLETSTRGTAILANLGAVPYPGGQTTIGVTNLDGEQFTIDIQIASGAVTLVKASLDVAP